MYFCQSQMPSNVLDIFSPSSFQIAMRHCSRPHIYMRKYRCDCSTHTPLLVIQWFSVYCFWRHIHLQWFRVYCFWRHVHDVLRNLLEFLFSSNQSHSIQSPSMRDTTVIITCDTPSSVTPLTLPNNSYRGILLKYTSFCEVYFY